MRRRRSRISAFTAGVTGIVLITIGSYFAYTKKIPFLHHFTVNAVFRTADNIRPGSKVRIAGVNVGQVSGVSRQGDVAVVSMQISSAGLPLHDDATARIRPLLFLEGNWFVDLTEGTPNAPVIKDGGTIPIQDTSTPVQFDQLLSALQSDSRSDLQVLLQQYSRALSGGGAVGYRNSIPYWAPAYEYGSIVNQATLGEAQHDLSGFIASAGAVAQATDRDPPHLRNLIADFDTVAGALASQHAALTATIEQLPRTLNAALPALQAVDAALPPVNRLAAQALPAVRSSGPTIDASLPFLHQSSLLFSPPELRGLIADLRPTIPSLAQLNAELVPLYQGVRLASSCQNQVILPWSTMTVPDPRFAASGPVYQEGVKWLPGIAGEARSHDANGQWARTILGSGTTAIPLGGDRFAISPFPILGTNPVKPTSGTDPLEPGVPCETQRTPDLRTDAGPAPPTVQLSLDAPGAQERAAQAEQLAITWLRQEIQRAGLGGEMRVSSTPFSASQLHAPDLGDPTGQR